MAKFIQIVLVVAVVAVCSAEPPRFRKFKTNRVFARQEVESAAPAAKAPYPPAGIKPEIPFELPTEATTAQPDNTYLPPDNTYGPPDNTYGPPDNTYGPPATEAPEVEAEVEPEVEPETPEVPEVLVVDDDDTDSVISVAVSYDQDNLVDPEAPQRIVFGQRTRPSQRLRAIRGQPILLSDGSFAFSTRL